MNILKSKRYAIGIIGTVMMIMVSLGTKQAQAIPNIGAPLYATGDNVTVTIGTRSAAFVNELWLCSPGILLPGPGNGVYVGLNTEYDKVVDLGVWEAGTELVFKLYVGDKALNITPTFFLGPANRNPDNEYHAAIDFDDPSLGQWEAYLEFEDFIDDDNNPATPDTSRWDHPWASDKEPDYNDCRFLVKGVSQTIVPEPSTMYLLGSGLIGLIGYGKKRLFRKDRKA